MKQKWPNEFWEIGNTEELLEMMRKYDKNSDYWNKYILILVLLYCVPDQKVRISSLESLTLFVNKELTRKLSNLRETNTIKDEELIFLKEDGTPILDFIDIPFSTSKLYLTKKNSPPTYDDSLQKYLDMVKRYK